MILIKQSFDKDLRQDDWKCTNTVRNAQLDRYEQDYEDKTGKKYHVETSLHSYDDAWGDPVIRYQTLYEVV